LVNWKFFPIFETKLSIFSNKSLPSRTRSLHSQYLTSTEGYYKPLDKTR